MKNFSQHIKDIQMIFLKNCSNTPTKTSKFFHIVFDFYRDALKINSCETFGSLLYASVLFLNGDKNSSNLPPIFWTVISITLKPANYRHIERAI